MPDQIEANLTRVMSDAELAEQRRLVQFYNFPWPMGPVEVIRGREEGGLEDRAAGEPEVS